jgi:hypothetical protein
MHEKSDVSTLETKLDRLALDAFVVEENGLAPAGIDVSRCGVAQAFSPSARRLHFRAPKAPGGPRSRPRPFGPQVRTLCGWYRAAAVIGVLDESFDLRLEVAG